MQLNIIGTIWLFLAQANQSVYTKHSQHYEDILGMYFICSQETSSALFSGGSWKNSQGGAIFLIMIKASHSVGTLSKLINSYSNTFLSTIGSTQQ